MAQPGPRTHATLRHRRESRCGPSPCLRSHRRADALGGHPRPLHEPTPPLALPKNPAPHFPTGLTIQPSMNHPLVTYPKNPDTPTSYLPFSPAVAVNDLIFI